MGTSTNSSSLGLFRRHDGGGPRGGRSSSPGPEPTSRRWSFFAAKRAVDVVGAAAGLTLLLPLMLAIAALIRLESPGPVLTRQTRTGRGGRRFRLLKYRTTATGAGRRVAHPGSPRGAPFEALDDPGVTPLGRFLRRSSLDELPQLLNVLRGELSLVGPRPLPPRDGARLGLRDPGAYARRLTVPPGLTGAWQVGIRGASDAEVLPSLDLDEVDRLSLAGDLAILWKALAVALRGRGAC